MEIIKKHKKYEPHKYQQQSIKYLCKHNHKALWFSPGLGKTSIILDTIMKLKKKGEIKKVLIIAPLKVVYLTWRQEAAKWTQFKDLKFAILHGNTREADFNSDFDIALVNFEGLDWLFNPMKGKLRNKKLLDKHGIDTLVVDELSKLKHTKSVRFKMLKPLLGCFKRRYGLTGSVTSNSLMDAFGQAYVIDEGQEFGRYITHFKNEYFMPLDFKGYTVVPKPGAEDRIAEGLSRIGLRLEADDIVELPDIINNTIKVQLNVKSRKLYDEVKNEFISMVDGNAVTAMNAATAAAKLRQITSGTVYLNPEDIENDMKLKMVGDRSYAVLHSDKLDALENLIDELQGAQLFVSYYFNSEREEIKKRFKNAVFIENNKSSIDVVNKWNNGEISLLFGHPQSVGHGLNLQGDCKHVCWLSLDWSYEVYEQFNKRVARQGNKHKKITVHHIIVEDTIDTSMFYSLRHKKNTQDSVYTKMIEYTKK